MTPLTSHQRTEVIKLLQQGLDRKAIASVVDASIGQVAAIAAHVTMQTYVRQGAQPNNDKSIAGEVPLAKAPSPLQAPREIVESEQQEISTSSAGLIYLGNREPDRRPTFWTPTPDSGTPNPHLLIIGESGSGKTYCTQCLCAEFSQVGIPTIVFDFGQGYSLSTAPSEFLSHARPIELEVGRQGIDINPLSIFPTDIHGPLNVAQRIADTFVRVYPGLGVQQHAVLRGAVLSTFLSTGIDPDRPETWTLPAPRFSALNDTLTSISNTGPQNVRRYASSAASHISTIFVFNTFRSSGMSIDWNGMLSSKGATYIIQLRGLEHQLERLVTELLLWNFIGYIESLGPGPLRCMVLLDEAHRLSFASNSPVEKMLREGRKFGLGVILASQQPEDFSPVAFANTATKIVLNVTDEKGIVTRQLARKSKSTIDFSTIAKQITTLPRGQCCFITNSEMSVVSITDFPSRVARWTDTKA